jgi:signal transduction histidine kinase
MALAIDWGNGLMFKSATLKLTLWYVLLIMGLSLLFSGILYRFSTGELGEALHNQYQLLNDGGRDDRSNISSHELDIHSRHLLENLIYFNAFVLIGSTLTSYLLAKRTLRPIEEAHQAQIRFTADASHELRTPLTAMKAGTEATLMKGPNDAALLRHTLKENLSDIEKLDKLTNHLLEISRHDSRSVSKLEVVELQSVTQEVLAGFKKSVLEKKLKVEAQTSPVQVRGESQGLHQLITIVLDNAIKYSRPKGRIKLSLTKKNRQAIIVIKDEGIGIPASDLPHIFERFYRSKNVSANKKKTSGYGLGLPLAQEIVQRHGGSIIVHSEEHKGTSVHIKLPVA